MSLKSPTGALDLSVIIPTFNGSQRIPAVLERLQNQTGWQGYAWEILIVDNNSHDRTAEIVGQWQEIWQSSVTLRYVFEPRQGLAFARQCGVDNARGSLVGFLDDDNWPQPNWVLEAIQFGLQTPRAGAFGGRTYPIFETAPADEIKALSKFLALQDLGLQPVQFQPHKLQLPAGAGLVVRRQAWQESVPARLHCTSGGGDDYEISIRMAQAGWQIWYAPALEIEHFIPAGRLEKRYLRQLTHRYGLRTCDLLMIMKAPWQRPWELTRSFLGSMRRIGSHLARHYLPNQRTLVTDCQLAFHWGNLKSPFAYLLRSWGRK